jgi:hypothetical protein
VLADATQAAATQGGWRRRLWLALVRRWIAAGQGCDADLQVLDVLGEKAKRP